MIDCTVTVDGAPVASTLADYASAPTALDGLTVTWGRSGQFDQPEASSAKIEIAVPVDKVAESVDRFKIGATVTITATRTSSDTPTQTIISDPAGRSGTVIEGGPFLFEWHPGPVSSDPTAWDGLPTVEFGTEYRLTADVIAALPRQIAVHPLYYDTPGGNPQVGAPVAYDGTAWTWQPPAEHIGQWVGVRITVSNIGPTWAMMGTKTWRAVPTQWGTYRTVAVRNLRLTRHGIITRNAPVFYGRIAAAPISWDESIRRPVITITATDIRADLAHQRIGDDPWPVETMAARLARILRKAGLELQPVVPEKAAKTLIAARDIDSTSVLDLLTDLAKSTGTILWVAAQTRIGGYLRFENTGDRIALYRLTTDKRGNIGVEPAGRGVTRLPARLIDMEGFTLTQDMADLASVVTVRWKDQHGEDETEREAMLAVPERVAAYGHRAVSVSTELTSAADATDLAQTIIKRAAPGGWTTRAAHFEPDTTIEEAAMQLLDTTKRLGHPVVLDGVAWWLPGAPSIPAYVDGGTITYELGRWQMDLTLTRAATPAKSITWRELPPATWRQATLTWLELSTVQGGP